MANEVKLKFTGDDSDLSKSIQDVEKDLGGLSKAADKADKSAGKMGRSAEDLSDGLGNASGKFRDTNDLVSGFADSVGLALPPQAQMLMGFADMADGLGGLLVPVLGKAKAAMALMNATIAANPIMATVIIIGLLIAAFVIAYKKSETFRNIVNSTWDAIKNGAQSAFKVVKPIFDLYMIQFQLLGKAAKVMADVIGKAFGAVKGAVSAAVGAVKGAWNSTIGGKGIHIPSIGIGPFKTPGVDFSIPYLANGGAMNGAAWVGERGPELMVGSGRVLSHSDSMKAVSGTGTPQTIVIELPGMVSLSEAIKKEARVRGGGNVQLAFGTR